ncbi:MAG: CHASE2 domain-containing protein [Spirochaetes bacterium]|nr:CHASE2 domain-containing protein [Spirochaetota bacterium]
MADRWSRRAFFATRNFGIVIGILVILFLLLLNWLTLIPERLELKVLDLHFNLKNITSGKRIQEGVSLTTRNPDISPDILILGIDFNSLTQLGKWPFPRYRHAQLLHSFARIQNQDERERALFLDIFFIEPDSKAYDDAILVESIRQNGRVFLETVLDFQFPPPGMEGEFFARQETLVKTFGEIRNVKGDWHRMPAFYGVQPPLKPFSKASRGYGHANFLSDYDSVYRRQPLVARFSLLQGTLYWEDLSVGTVPLDPSRFEWIGWADRDGKEHPIPFPLTSEGLSQLKKTLEEKSPPKAEDTNGDGKPDRFRYVLRKYRDYFIPSITLALACEYFQVDIRTIEVELGKEIVLPNPKRYDAKTKQYVPYKDALRIPINAYGEMLVNFMGPPSSASPDGHQTFPVRSYAAYVARVPGEDPSTWPRTKAVANKILMVGPFTEGMAADQKPTPLGLMYGVEIHANSLNTILMEKFLQYASEGVNILILAVLVLGISFMVSRLSTIWSFAAALVTILVLFIVATLVFDSYAYILNFTLPALGILLSFVSIVVYRAMTEERDKRRIKEMFGKYVSPKVVEQILEHPPELGGVDKELTVFFSDIRGFTTLSESMTPQELVNHLNEYLTAMTDIILSYNGTLDKYVGDEVMCFWGAPLPQEDHAILACKCALKQMEVLAQLNAKWPPERRIDIGIGINSGIMTVGNMGSPGRMNYTLMGDNVNLGARLEGTNKEYQTHIIISEYTYALVKDRVIARELDNIRVKGKNRPVLIYELIDVPEGY